MKILLDQPGLAVLISLVVATAATGLVYWRTTGTTKLRVLLAILRGTLAFLLALLLFEPLIESLRAINHKPALFIAVDRSTSIAEPDQLKLEAFLTASTGLEEVYDVHVFSFGSDIASVDSLKWNASSTNMGEAMRHLAQLHRPNHSSTAIILSDGIVNQGADPMAMKDAFPGRIFTWTVGDTSSPADSWLHGAEAPKVVFLNNQFVLDAWFETKNLPAGYVQLKLEDELGKVLETRNITWKTSGRIRQRFVLGAEAVGTKRFKLVTSIPNGDSNPANNYLPVVVRIEERKKDIWLVSGAPHPDVAALVEALKPLQEYTLHVITNSTPSNSTPAVLLFVHPLPEQKSLVNGMLNRYPNAGRGWFLGNKESFDAYRSAFIGLPNQFNPRYEDVYAWPNSSFNLFSQPSVVQEAYKTWPPVKAAVVQNAAATNTSALLEKIGEVTTTKPLWSFTTSNQTNELVVPAQGFWQWRLAAYRSSRDFADFDQLILGSVRLLSSPPQANKLEVNIRPQWYLGEQVQAFASFTDNAGEFTQDAQISLVVEGENLQPVSYGFTPNAPFYAAFIGQLGKGNYSYRATTTWQGKKYATSGSFEVSAVDLESMDRHANYSLMKALTRNGAAVVGDASAILLDELRQTVPAGRRELKSEVIDFTRFLPLLIGLLLVFLTEITIRRFFGSL